MTFREEIHEAHQVDQVSYVECDAIDDGDDEDIDELPDLVQCDGDILIEKTTCHEVNECKSEECTIEQCKTDECQVEECKIEKIEEEIESKENIENNNIDESKSDTRDSEIEKQLEIVRKQLEELSQLPSTIQATIEEVKKQIAGLIQFKNIEIQRNNNATATEVSSNQQKLTKENEENLSEEDQQTVNSENEQNVKEEIESDANKQNGQASEHSVENVTNGTTIEHSEEITVQKEEFESETVASVTSDSTEIIAARADAQIERLKIEQCFSEQRERWFNERKQV